MTNTLIDAGPMIALFDKDDEYHKIVKEFLRNFKGRLFTSWPVITEVSHMLKFNVKVQIDFLKWINRNIITIIGINKEGLSRIIELSEKYSNVPMDLADGSLLWISEDLKMKNIITLDSDYYIYRTKNKKYLNYIFDKYS